MPKKSNKTRADGRIAVQVYLGKVDGKRKYKTVYGKTQKEANALAAEIKKKLAVGIELTEKEYQTFNYWADAWLEHKKHSVTSDRYLTLATRSGYWKNELIGYNIDRIQFADLDRILHRLADKNPTTGKPTAKKTLTEIKNIVNNIFEYAIQNRVTEFNPAKFLEIPKEQPKSERRALTNEEIQRIEDTPDDFQLACMLMIYAGLRRGELIALTWSDIDMNSKTININKSADLSQNHAKLKETKTKAGTRIVPMPDVLYNYLLDIKHTSFLVYEVKGRMMTDGEWSIYWRNYFRKLNAKYGDFENVYISDKDKKYGLLPTVIETYTAHCLRHTYCTLLYESGIDVLTAKEYMGHNDVTTTMKIYTHLREERKEKSVEKLNDYLNKLKSTAKEENASQN